MLKINASKAQDIMAEAKVNREMMIMDIYDRRYSNELSDRITETARNLDDYVTIGKDFFKDNEDITAELLKCMKEDAEKNGFTVITIQEDNLYEIAW